MKLFKHRIYGFIVDTSTYTYKYDCWICLTTIIWLAFANLIDCHFQSQDWSLDVQIIIRGKCEDYICPRVITCPPNCINYQSCNG